MCVNLIFTDTLDGLRPGTYLYVLGSFLIFMTIFFWQLTYQLSHYLMTSK